MNFCLVHFEAKLPSGLPPRHLNFGPITPSVPLLLKVPNLNRKFLLVFLSQIPDSKNSQKFAVAVASGDDPEEAALAIFLLATLKFENASFVSQVSSNFLKNENLQISCLHFFLETRQFPAGISSLLDRIFQNHFINANVSNLICKVATEALKDGNVSRPEKLIFLKISETLVVSEDPSLARSALLLLETAGFEDIPFSLTLEISKNFRNSGSLFLGLLSRKKLKCFGEEEFILHLLITEFLEDSPLLTSQLLLNNFEIFCENSDILEFASRAISALARDNLTLPEAECLVQLLLDWIESEIPSKKQKLPVFKNFQVDGMGALAILGGLVEKFAIDGNFGFCKRVFRIIHEICRFKILREKLFASESFSAAMAKFTEAQKSDLSGILIEKTAKIIEKTAGDSQDDGFLGNFFASPPRREKIKTEQKAEIPKVEGKVPVENETTQLSKAVDKQVKEATGWFDAGIDFITGDSAKLEKLKKKAEKKRLKEEVKAAAAEEKRKVEEEKSKKVLEAKKLQQIKLIAAARAKARAAAETKKKGWFS